MVQPWRSYRSGTRLGDVGSPLSRQFSSQPPSQALNVISSLYKIVAPRAYSILSAVINLRFNRFRVEHIAQSTRYLLRQTHVVGSTRAVHVGHVCSRTSTVTPTERTHNVTHHAACSERCITMEPVHQLPPSIADNTSEWRSTLAHRHPHRERCVKFKSSN